MKKTNNVTELLKSYSAGRKSALDEAVPLIYEELKKIARGHLRRTPGQQTLSVTGLVNEAYLAIRKGENLSVESRKHFYSVASRCMHFILTDRLRAKYAEKRGGAQVNLVFDEAKFRVDGGQDELAALDEAIARLGRQDPRMARVIELRSMMGYTIEETSELLGVSVATVKRDWAVAVAWLRKELYEEAAA